jgi:GTP pyrophosphokinase
MKEVEINSLVNELNSFTPGKNLNYYPRLKTAVKIIINASSGFTKIQRVLVIYALMLAAEMHKGVYRKDKVTPYLVHPFEVASIIIVYFGIIDFKIIIAAILHDVIEDKKGLKNKQELRKRIREKFGFTVYSIIDFVTKHESVERRNKYYQIMCSIRLISVKWRTIVIKMADRINNAETFKHIEKEERKRKIEETLEEFPVLEIELKRTLLKAYKKGEIRNKKLLTIPERAMDRIFIAIDPYT